MDANLFSQIASGIGMAGGLWALVRWAEERKHNGNGHGSPSEPPLTNQVQQETKILVHLVQSALNENSENMKRLADAVTEVAHQKNEPQPDPVWVKDLNRRVFESTERMEAVLQMGPPVVEAPHVTVEAPAAGLPDFSEIERRLGQVVQQISRLVTPSPPKPKSDGEEPAALARGPIQRIPTPRQLQQFNTVGVAEFTVVEMLPPEPDVFSLSIMNLGPGTVYCRADQPPTDVGDPFATTIPPGTGDNSIQTPARLFVLADLGGGTLSVRLSH
jgi:hypothetical protein